MRRWLSAVALLLVAAFGVLSVGTTTASAAVFAYDAPADARVDLLAIGTADTRPALFNNVRKQSASQFVEGRSASTTLSAPVIATEAAGSTIDDLLRPGGSLIGKAGTDETIRELTGGLTDARAMFQQLSRGATVVEQTATITRVQLADGGIVQLRTVMSRSPRTVATIDANIPGLDITKVKFNP